MAPPGASSRTIGILGRRRADFASSVSACPQMDAALDRLALRVSRKRARQKPGERPLAETRRLARNDRASALFSTHPRKAASRWRTLMREQKMAEAYKSWRQALENMRQAFTMNPLVTEPLRASAEAFESVGRVLFGANSGGRSGSTRKTRTRAAAARSHTRSKVKTRSRRRRRSPKKA